jgi:glycerophosphoryl diester phosphodiesterase
VPPALYAHRLGRAYGPDSSLAALRRALQQPLDGLETDCCLTADGELVLLHDPLLDLGTTMSGWTHQRTAVEIRAGWLRNLDGTVSDERPLLLDELLDLAPPGATLQLEVKAHADPSLARHTARAVCERLRDHPARERTEVISFWSGACELAADLGFLARLVIIAEYRIPALAAWGRRVGLHGVCVEHFLLSRTLVANLRASGLSVTTGTVNHASILAPLLPLGLDAITSDAPHELRQALNRSLQRRRSPHEPPAYAAAVDEAPPDAMGGAVKVDATAATPFPKKGAVRRDRPPASAPFSRNSTNTV